MFEIGQIIFFYKGAHIFVILPEAPLWLVSGSIPVINWSFVKVVLWKLIVLLPFSFPVNIVSGAKLKLGKFAIKLVGGGANIRNTDEFSLPYIQLIQLPIQVIIHHPIDPTTNPSHHPFHSDHLKIHLLVFMCIGNIDWLDQSQWSYNYHYQSPPREWGKQTNNLRNKKQSQKQKKQSHNDLSQSSSQQTNK